MRPTPAPPETILSNKKSIPYIRMLHRQSQPPFRCHHPMPQAPCSMLPAPQGEHVCLMPPLRALDKKLCVLCGLCERSSAPRARPHAHVPQPYVTFQDLTPIRCPRLSLSAYFLSVPPFTRILEYIVDMICGRL